MPKVPRFIMKHPDPPGGGRDDALNDLYEALSHDRRRTVLAVLTEVEPPVDAHTLARRVSERERGDVSEEAVERAHVSLHHVHLPRLSAVGLLDYDPDRRTVVDLSDEVDSLLS